MTPKKPMTKRDAAKVNPRFMSVVEAFAKDRYVSHGKSKGFSSGALKVNGKIFAMVSSKGQFVVKLPQKRVNELVSSGRSGRFDPVGGE